MSPGTRYALNDTRTQEATMTARRILMAEAVLVGGALVALLVKEWPGMVREVRIWRMVGLRPGSRPGYRSVSRPG